MEEEVEVQNPLLNELVLENLFKYMNQVDLMACRLVCKKWKYHANYYIRKQKKLEFFGYELNRIEEFFNVVQETDPDDFPFAKFGIQIWDTESFRSRFLSLSRNSEKFFAICAPHAETLHFHFNDFLETYNSNFQSWFLGSILKIKTLELTGKISVKLNPEVVVEHTKLPRIERLILSNELPQEPRLPLPEEAERQELNNVEDKKENERRVIELVFKMCSHLHTFVLTDRHPKPTYVPLCLTIISKSGLWIRNLHLKCAVSDEGLRTITDSKFELNSLEIHALDLDVKASTLEKLLFAERKYLRKLLLGEEEILRHVDGPALKIPCMEELTNLTIKRRTAAQVLRFDDNVYRDCFPKLANLDFRNIMFGILDFFPAEYVGNEILQKLDLPPNFADPICLQDFFYNFPALRSLSLQSPPEIILRLIWEYGQNLTELKISNVSEHRCDSILSGIHPRIIDWIVEDHAFSRLNDNFFEVVNRRTSMCNLRSLQRFWISTNPDSNPDERLEELNNQIPAITDIFVYLVLPHLTELTSLTTTSTGCQLSEGGLSRLRSFDRLHHYQFDHEN